MKSEKVLYFLTLLSENTQSHTQELSNLFQNALDSNDTIIQAKHIYKNYNMYGEIGANLRRALENMLKKIYADPSSALSLLPYLRQACESVEKYATISEDDLLSPLYSRTDITVLKRKDETAYMLMLRKIASVCVYLIAVYSGPESLKYLTWNDNVGIREYCNAVNTFFLPKLCSLKKPDTCWVITRCHMENNALFSIDYFTIEYKPVDYVNILCGAFQNESINTHMYLNTNAYETRTYHTPYCWGVGNIVSSNPDYSLEILQHIEIITKLRVPSQNELLSNMPTPFRLVQILSDDKVFCISPETLVKSMNQWQCGHDLMVKQLSKRCLFCGKQIIDDRLVCKDHFTYNLE